MTGEPRVNRKSPEWQRIRSQMGPHSIEIDLDEHADFVYRITQRQKWNVEEELAAELHDTLDEERSRPNGRDAKRRRKQKA